jgi:predicted dehydrogenase
MKVRLVLAGYGQVGREKFIPALITLASKENILHSSLLKKDQSIELLILDIRPDAFTQIELDKQEYQQKVPNLEIIPVPYEIVASYNTIEQFLGTKPIDVSYIATPNNTHAQYLALFLRKSKQIFVEKPIVDNLSELTIIDQTYSKSMLSSIHLIDHYLYKEPLPTFFKTWETCLKRIGTLKQVSFVLVEKKEIPPTRQWLYQSGMIRDLATHGFSILFRLYESGLTLFNPNNFQLINCQKGWYDGIPPEIEEPKETAAKLEYTVQDVPYQVIVGKSAAFDQKKLLFHGQEGTIAIDMVDQSISLIKNDDRILLYENVNNESSSKEYEVIIESILKNNHTFALSYQQAKEQIRLIEKTDDIKKGKIYDRNNFPFLP